MIIILLFLSFKKIHNNKRQLETDQYFKIYLYISRIFLMHMI